MTIELITEAPMGVIGMRAVGKVTADDYIQVMDPALNAAIDSGAPVNLVYVIGADFEHYSLGALWQDAKLEGLPHQAWGRIALVTDHQGLAETVHLLRFAFPGLLRIFPNAHESDALTWAAGSSA